MVVFRCSALAALAGAWIVLSTSPLLAEEARAGDTAPAPAEAIQAEALFLEGRRLLQVGDPESACAKLSRSYALDPATGTLLAIALCHEARGRHFSAWGTFLSVVGQAKQQGRADRAAFALAHAEALLPQLPALTIQVAEEVRELNGLTITSNGTPVAPNKWGLKLALDPDSYTIVANAPGYRAATVTVKLGGRGADRQVVVIPSLKPLVPPTPADAPPAPPGGTEEPGRVPQGAVSYTRDTEPRTAFANYLGWTAAGVAVGLSGVAWHFNSRATAHLEERDQRCPTVRCEVDSTQVKDRVNWLSQQAEEASIYTAVSLGLSAANLVAAALLLWPEAQRPSPLPVRSIAVGGGAGAAINLKF